MAGKEESNQNLEAGSTASARAFTGKGDYYCSEGDVVAMDAVFSEDEDKGVNATVLADVTKDEIDEQTISDTKAQKGVTDAGFSEVVKYGDPKVESHKTMGDEDEDADDEGDDDEEEEDEEEDENDEEEDEDGETRTVVLGGVKYRYRCRDYSSDDSVVEYDWDLHTDGEYWDESEADFQVAQEKADAKLNRFMERLRARTKTLVFKDEEVCA
jgi:hypothetical protein